MRQIKFRIWDAELKRMFYPGDKVSNVIALFYDRDGDLTTFKIGEASEEWEIIGATHSAEIEYNTSVPMQFTGLFDKNGKEIYEGDIIELGQYADVRMPVVFHNGSFCIHGYNWKAEECEVIHNIYESKTDPQP